MPTPATVPTKPYKAVVAFVLTFLGLIVQALTTHGDARNIAGSEWLVIIVGSLVTTGAVYGITNPAASSSGL
jgi:hypothetical protein